MARDNVKYETDEGVVLQIALDTAKIALAGTAPTGEIDQSNIFVSPNAARRKRNVLRARAWVYKYTEVTEGGLTASKTLRLPKVTLTAYAAAAPTTQAYKGTTYTFVTKDAEG